MSAIFPFIYKRTAKTACLEEHHIGPSPIQYVVGGGEFVWDKRATENKPFHLTINICYSQLTPGVTAFYHKRTSKG